MVPRRYPPAVLLLLAVSTAACRCPSRFAPATVALSPGDEADSAPDASPGPEASANTTVTTMDLALARVVGGTLSGRTVLVKDWPERPGLMIALIHAEPKEITSGRDLDAHIVLLRHAGTGVEVVATTAFVPELDTNPAWHVDPPELDLDFARYELRVEDVAFGVRLGLTIEFPAGENESRTLYLFRTDGSELVEILHTRVQETDEQRGPNELRESTRIVAIAPETTGGFHDLLVHAQWSSGPLITDDPHPKQRKGHSSQRWRWDGKRYGSPSEEPSEPPPPHRGHSCRTDADCAPDCICGFPRVARCAARGTCFPRLIEFGTEAPEGCACDETSVSLGSNGLPAGFQSKPFRHAGPCNKDPRMWLPYEDPLREPGLTR